MNLNDFSARDLFRAGRRLLWVIVVPCLVAGGCTTQTTAEQASPKGDPPADATPHQDGIVKIREASRPFIEVEEVSGAKTDSTISAPARMEFRDGAVSQVGVPLDGRVQTVHVSLGQQVQRGDALVTLDCPDAAATRASVEVAQAALREARSELERQRRMQKEGVGTERDLVSAETKVSSSEAEVARAESAAGSIGNGTATAVVVRAPIAGIVIIRKASVGMAVQHGGDPLFEIGDASSLWVVADVFERDLRGVRTGSKGRIAFPSVGHDIDGRVASVGAVVGSGLRTAPVYLTIEGARPALRPGTYGRVEIQIADAAVTLPTSAVLIKDGMDPVVYVQQDALTYQRRSVVIAQPVEGRVQVVSGLSPGDKVVVRGALLLDGSADQLL
jgi:cobalt-zinc-cadmium efflux system membrane fusion protein